jgi:hypothetical protein
LGGGSFQDRENISNPWERTQPVRGTESSSASVEGRVRLPNSSWVKKLKLKQFRRERKKNKFSNY